MQEDVNNMTKPVIIKPSGKVQGIKGLYQDPSSKRLYIRYSFHGIDRQRTIYPKNLTFSELSREAAKAMNALKKEVKAQIVEPVGDKPETISIIDYGIKRLPEEISRHWGCKGTTQKYIAELLRVTAGLAICESKKLSDIAEVDRYNKARAAEVIQANGLSQCQRFKRYNGIRQCFDALIALQVHRGVNPVIEVPKPVYVQGRRTAVMDFPTAARVICAIRKNTSAGAILRAEMELFFRLCVETGQRPKDVYMFDATKIDDRHYHFRSHKTRREQRVAHLLSDAVRKQIGEIILARSGTAFYEQVWPNKHGVDETFHSFWCSPFDTFRKTLNDIIHSVAGDGISLYATRHFFITEMFRRTNSEFWAEVFTHEGKTVNQRNYLHPEQKKADEILTGFCMDFQDEVDKI